MLTKEELLSNLLFPEDRGNCRLQTGVITLILKENEMHYCFLNIRETTRFYSQICRAMCQKRMIHLP